MSKTRFACVRPPLFSARWHVCCACLGINKGDDATHDEFGLLVNQQIRAVRHGHHADVRIALFQLFIFRQIEQAVLGRHHAEHGNGQSVDRAAPVDLAAAPKNRRPATQLWPGAGRLPCPADIKAQIDQSGAARGARSSYLPKSRQSLVRVAVCLARPYRLCEAR